MRGSKQLSKEFVAKTKRIPIMDAAAQLVGDQGVEATSISDLASKARCARITIYLNFSGKQDCLEQALSWIGQSIRGAVSLSLDPGLGALLDFAHEHPHRAAFYLEHGPKVSLSIWGSEQSALAELIDPDLGLSESARLMVVGGLTETLRRYLARPLSSEPRSHSDLSEEFASFLDSVSPGVVDAPLAVVA